MQVDGVKVDGYTATVNANGGEEQFIIIQTSRQDGQTSYVLASASVDSEARVLSLGLIPSPKFREKVCTMMTYWDLTMSYGNARAICDLIDAADGGEPFFFELSEGGQV